MYIVGDKVKIINPLYTKYGKVGTIKENGDVYVVDFDGESFPYAEIDLERVDNMDLSERLSEVIKENQSIKQQLSEQNIRLNKLQADMRREQGVSDEELRETIRYYSIIDDDKRYEIWGIRRLNYLDLFTQMSLPEFVNKYKEYKDKQDNEIEVGDECRYKNGVDTFIVTSIYVDNGVTWFDALRTDGDVLQGGKIEFIKKTGRHFDEVEALLSKLKGSD